MNLTTYGSYTCIVIIISIHVQLKRFHEGFMTHETTVSSNLHVNEMLDMHPDMHQPNRDHMSGFSNGQINILQKQSMIPLSLYSLWSIGHPLQNRNFFVVVYCCPHCSCQLLPNQWSFINHIQSYLPLQNKKTTIMVCESESQPQTSLLQKLKIICRKCGKDISMQGEGHLSSVLKYLCQLCQTKVFVWSDPPNIYL